jgi:hypothetical protein
VQLPAVKQASNGQNMAACSFRPAYVVAERSYHVLHTCVLPSLCRLIEAILRRLP